MTPAVAPSPLSGRTALVTGGGRGLGRAISLQLGQAGARVVVNYLNDEEAARATVQAIEAAGGEARTAQADVANGPAVIALVDGIPEGIDILVNNAGYARPRSLDELTETDFDDAIHNNLKSVFLCTQAVLPRMRRQRWGRIVNMSSAAVHLGGKVGVHYTASKAGIIGLTHAYAAALAREQVTVNAVAPALIDTGAGFRHTDASFIPVGRFGAPDEVAQAVVLLACNAYMTGQTLSVNGGWYMT